MRAKALAIIFLVILCSGCGYLSAYGLNILSIPVEERTWFHVVCVLLNCISIWVCWGFVTYKGINGLQSKEGKWLKRAERNNGNTLRVLPL